MITIYGGGRTRSLRVAWMAEEMGLDYEIRPVSLMETKSDPAFKALNPAGFLPVMQDGDVTMIESVAMMEYLAARYGPTPLVPSTDDPTWVRYKQFLHFGESSVAALLNIAVGSKFAAPREHRDNWGAALAVDLAMSRSCMLANQLKDSEFIAGDAFTAADISVAYPFLLAKFIGFQERVDPIIQDYVVSLRARPAFERALARSNEKAA
ncbi:glutathione S-transferase family protein [Caulobacter sp. 73W]|uniref:Glutathione S-transferase family protein n=1 Tax=Caulobacter sp. 73W TaxID=3161137 RepID=A0AB39KNF2_9CAUL